MRPRRLLTFPARIQARLTRYYALDDAPGIDDFVRATDGDPREALSVRQLPDGIELALHLPRRAIEQEEGGSLDGLCQVVEGVSHFLFLAERARRELPTTQLELELQAEVDKYVMLAIDGAEEEESRPHPSRPGRAAELRERLFDRIHYLHPKGTERGDRYRMANDLAARFVQRLEVTFASRGHFDQLRQALRRFYASGQREKIELAQAA